MKNRWYDTEMKPLCFKDLINDLYCVKCHQLPKAATTVGCGHTLCRACLDDCKSCPCGRYHPPVLERNFVADKLISYISKTDRNNNGTTRTSIGNNTDSIDLYSIEACIQSEAFQCSICTEMFLNPVTTPCGHTFCRWCLEMSTEVYNRCALCKCDLQMLGFVSDNTEDTLIIKAALKLGGYPSEAVPEPNDEIPIVSCTVSYPTLSCPLYIKHPRYTFAIRRSLRTGRKLFGIVHDETADCGTVMEIKDFVSLGNGRCVVTSIGIARFRILERSVKNGCLVAKYERIFDLNYSTKADAEYNLFTRVHTMTVNWFMEIPAYQQDEVVREYGHWSDRDWWMTGMDRQADGPSFIWWALAILPISNQLKAYVLECTSMYRRLIALDTILTIIFNPIVRSLLLPETKSP